MQQEQELSQERLPGESLKWYARYLKYRDRGPDRTLLGLVKEEYLARTSTIKHNLQVPGAWHSAYARFHWKERAAQHDEYMRELEAARRRILYEIEQAEIERILTTGYAAKHERVCALTKWIDALGESMIDPETGAINPKWVSSAKIEQIRGCLDDIAKEVGHRIQKNEITGKDGGPVEFITTWGGGVLDEEEEKVKP